MKTNRWQRASALLTTAMLAGSLLATVAGPGIALGATDPGCTQLGGDDGPGGLYPAGICEVSGLVAVPASVSVGEPLHLLAGAHLDATEQAGGFTLTVTGDLTMDAGSLIEGDDRAGQADPTGGRNLAINVSGDLDMAAGSRISSDNNVAGGTGGEILITVGGDMTMHGTADLVAPFDSCRNSPSQGDGLGFYNYGAFGTPDVIVNPSLGAVISAHRYGASSSASGGHIAITVGNYGVPPTGTLTMERCSLIDVSSRGSAGQIELTAGETADLDGLVLSESGQTGNGNAQNQARGGGPINVRAGCELTVSDTGVISSKGADPGADLVQLKGCEVLVNGVVQSTAPGAGHVIPVANFIPTTLCNTDTTAHPNGAATGFTACVRILGETVTIDARGNHNGNVNADGIRATFKAWIDIFATKDIFIYGDAAPAPWAVSANACAVGQCSNSFGGVITIKAIGGKVVAEGQAVRANATAIGSDGGIVTIQAGGTGAGTPGAPNATSNIDLDSSFVEANGPTSSNTAGGVIKVKSFNGSITSDNPTTGHIQALGGQAPGNGSITLEECSAIDSYLGAVSPAATENRGVCGGAPTVPADAQALFTANAPIWVACNFESPLKQGMKFNDLDNSGSFTAGDTPIEGWPINLLKLNGSWAQVDSTTTSATGIYSFVIAAPGTYRVCEGTLAGGYVQTAPNVGTTPPAGESVTSLCPGVNSYGYQFTVAGGENLQGNDFGNRIPSTEWCEKEPVQTVLNPTTGQYPGNKGPDVVVRVDLGESVQDAVDNEGDSNGDGYIIIAVSAHADGSLGGSAAQKVAVALDYGELKPFALIGCSVTLTGGGSDPSVWVKSTANAKNITIGGRTTDIFVMDLHGSDSSAAGVQTNDTNTYFRNVYGMGSAAGVKILGNNNTFHNGKGEDNDGPGVVVTGNGNLVEDIDAFGNSGHGFSVTGSANELTGLDAGDSGKGNTGDGVHVEGNDNLIEEVDAFANGGDGIEVIGAYNTLGGNRAGDRNKGNTGHGIVVTGNDNELFENEASANGGDGFRISGDDNYLEDNESNTGTSGGDKENTGPEYRLLSAIIDGGGNQKDDAPFTSTAIGAYE